MSARIFLALDSLKHVQSVLQTTFTTKMAWSGAHFTQSQFQQRSIPRDDTRHKNRFTENSSGKSFQTYNRMNQQEISKRNVTKIQDINQASSDVVIT